jgi:hypothetical protein
MLTVLHALHTCPSAHAQVVDQAALAQGESHEYCLRSTRGPLSVMLVWYDPPGSPSADTVLVNDLDLEVRPACYSCCAGGPSCCAGGPSCTLGSSCALGFQLPPLGAAMAGCCAAVAEIGCLVRAGARCWAGQCHPAGQWLEGQPERE